ncbi:hypothetical protein M9435_005908 [Picochlorum sp. BPE23]|nr:hypothetical protein M9435_005908 [Picochlorum sp. BPE23]
MFGARSWSISVSALHGLHRLCSAGGKQRRFRHHRTQSIRSANINSSASSGMNPLFKSAIISGSLSLTGDLVAQILQKMAGGPATEYDIFRAARMGSFGLFLYGPYQHYWYRALDRAFNARSTKNFAIKVFMNQTCLAPIVISAVFAWTLALQNKLDEFPEKCNRDFKNTLFTGWKFWVPASSINFVLVPLQHQVLYMSCCGVVWTAFLSYSSSKQSKALDGK